MKEVKEILKKALIELEEIKIHEDMKLIDSYINGGSTYKLYINKSNYESFEKKMEGNFFTDYKVLASGIHGKLYGFCCILLEPFDKNKTSLQINDVAYEIIIE